MRSHPGLRLTALCRDRWLSLHGDRVDSRQEDGDIHWGGGFDVYYSSLPPVCRAGIRWSLRRAIVVGVQTEQLRRSLGGDFPNLKFIPNWAGFRSRRPISVAASGQIESGGRFVPSPDSTVRFLYLGQVKREKGILLLIEAFASAHEQLSARGISTRLDIYGPEVDRVLAEAKPLLESMADAIAYRGEVTHERVPAILRSADVLVLPTTWPTEGHPAVVIEAMLHGLPVIATRFRALPEIVIQDLTGLLCEPGDTESLAQRMVRIAADPDLRRSTGAAALEKAMRFDSTVVLPELCRLFGIRLREANRAGSP